MAALLPSPSAQELTSAQVQSRNLLHILQTASDEALVLALVELCRARRHLLGAVVSAMSAAHAAEQSAAQRRAEGSAGCVVAQRGGSVDSSLSGFHQRPASCSYSSGLGGGAAQPDAESGSDWQSLVDEDETPKSPAELRGGGDGWLWGWGNTSARTSWASESSEGASEAAADPPLPTLLRSDRAASRPRARGKSAGASQADTESESDWQSIADEDAVQSAAAPRKRGQPVEDGLRGSRSRIGAGRCRLPATPALLGSKASSTASRTSWASESSESAAEFPDYECGSAVSSTGYAGTTEASLRSACAEGSSLPPAHQEPGSCSSEASECSSWQCPTPKVDMRFETVQGVLYPSFWNHEEIGRLRDRWESRKGDVVLAAPWPLRGLKRILTAIVEGRTDDPYAEGFMDKPRMLEICSSKNGADFVLNAWSEWPQRRVIETLALPHEVPFAWPPSDDDVLAGTAPKVVVIVADPRYALALLWDMLSSFSTLRLPMREGSDPGLAGFVEALVDEHFGFFADPFKHSTAWAQEATRWPDHVKVMRLERFASQDPREVSAACAEFAEVVGVKDPEAAAMRLMTAVARRPRWAAQSLAKDSFPDPVAVRGGPLVELVAPRIQEFEASLASLGADTKASYRKILFDMMDNPLLADIAGRAVNGVSSIPPLRQFSPLKGEAAHAAGTCRMCVFALRGACRNSPEMCPFCHLPGHTPPKRPSKQKRIVTKRNAAQARCRTPSVDGLSS